MKNGNIRVTPYVKSLIEELQEMLENHPEYKIYGPLTQSAVIGIAVQHKLKKRSVNGVKNA